MSKSENTDAMGEIFFALCKRVNSPVSLKAWLLYKYGEHLQLAEFRVDPLTYTSCDAFREDYLVTSYLSKWKGLVTGVDLKRVALEGFVASEIKCKETNERLRKSLRGDYNPRVEPILLLAQRKIGEILKGCRFIDAFDGCRWGKGATSTLKQDEATLVRKINPGKGRFSVTRRAVPYFLALLDSDPAWMSAISQADVLGQYCTVPSLTLEIVQGNRITTVPKDATKDRTIAAEPTANIFMQLGIGRLFRKVLKSRCGIDLDDQKHNQRAALYGSITGRVATVDMKSASDTVSTELVKQLLPYEWSVLLDQLRSPKGTLGSNDWFEYEKFSSMGNGFTFELETMIFWALAVACAQHLGCRERVLVYGDDVILPVEALDLYREVLSFCGFEVNTKKTHGQGSFRESCGRHYWAGVDVTPVYQKEVFWEYKGSTPRLLLPEAYRCCNRLLRYALTAGRNRWLCERIQPAWNAACRTFGFNRTIRHAVPVGAEDDDGLLLPWERCVEIGTAAGHWIEGIRLPVLTFKPAKLYVRDDMQGSLLAYWLRQSAGKVQHVLLEGEYPFWWGTSDLTRSEIVGLVEYYSAIRADTFAGYLTVRRRGVYVSRRRVYPRGTLNVAWM